MEKRGGGAATATPVRPSPTMASLGSTPALSARSATALAAQQDASRQMAGAALTTRLDNIYQAVTQLESDVGGMRTELQGLLGQILHAVQENVVASRALLPPDVAMVRTA